MRDGVVGEDRRGREGKGDGDAADEHHDQRESRGRDLRSRGHAGRCAHMGQGPWRIATAAHGEERAPDPGDERQQDCTGGDNRADAHEDVHRGGFDRRGNALQRSS